MQGPRYLPELRYAPDVQRGGALVDRVLPNAPLRQWVLSLPFELRGVAATKPDVLGAMDRIFAEEIERLTKRLAGIAGTATGSIGFPQRFGSSLNLHVHLHTLAIDGVFDKTDDGGVCVHETPPPSKDDVEEVARRVRDRALRWLRRHSYLDERAAEERGNERREPDALQGACSSRSLALPSLRDPRRPKEIPTPTWSAGSGASRHRATASTCIVPCASRPATTKVASGSCTIPAPVLLNRDTS